MGLGETGCSQCERQEQLAAQLQPQRQPCRYPNSSNVALRATWLWLSIRCCLSLGDCARQEAANRRKTALWSILSITVRTPPFRRGPGAAAPAVPGRAIETASGLRAELFGYRYQGLIPVKIQNFRFAILVGRSTSIIRAARPIWKTPSHSSRAAGPTLRLPCVGSTDCLPAQCRGRRLRRTACVSSPTVAQAAGRKLACASSASLNSVRRISIRRRATWHRTPLVEHLFRNRARLKPVVPLRQRSRVESCREPGEILSDPHTSAGRRRILKTAGKGRLSMRDSTA